MYGNLLSSKALINPVSRYVAGNVLFVTH
uniref:Uncharacterized protein n=1 Tax=Rhizophora mucronata TaxID=61149 RepID=A0A2P2Q7E0_RHIMU